MIPEKVKSQTSKKKDDKDGEEVLGAVYMQKDIVDYFTEGDESIPEEGFDLMVMMNVLAAPLGSGRDREHLGRRIDKLLEGVLRHLKKGGRLIVEENLGDVNKRVFSKELKRLLEKAGFEEIVISDREEDLIRPVLWNNQAFNLQAKKPS